MICRYGERVNGSHQCLCPKPEPLTNYPMTTALQPARSTFSYRRTKPFSNAEFKFKTTLADFASEALLPKLRARTSKMMEANQYSGVNVRVAGDIVYLEAILTNATEWGGFGFDFARLLPVKGGTYNVSVRRCEDWERAEHSTVACASNYFLVTAMSPRASDWIQLASARTFEECIAILVRTPGL
jgi:hypothetical protein